MEVRRGDHRPRGQIHRILAEGVTSKPGALNIKEWLQPRNVSHMEVASVDGVIAKQPHVLPLQAGKLVTTGTLTAALPIHAGQNWTTNLNGIALPGISVSFEV